MLVGKHLGPYRIIGKVGEGGMGEVYQARDMRLDRIVAIKVITGGGALDLELRTRFEREARAISSLNHPNICVLHDIGRERPLAATDGTSGTGRASADDVPLDFLVMEYLEGETLAARLARGPARSTPKPAPPMTVDEVVAIAIQIASALDAAHREGIVHRDLKPGNVMLTKAPRAGSPAGTPAPVPQVKLMDFGLARLSGADTRTNGGPGDRMVSLAELSMPTVSSPLTKKGILVGTLQYMSPEQIEGKGVDARTDIFALGIVLYEMLSGRRPFEGKSQASVIGAILEHDPPPVTSLQPQTPPLLAELVARCLAKDPDGRWQSARDLTRQLEWIAARTDTVAPGATRSRTEPHRLRDRLLLTGTAVLAGAAIAGGAVSWALWPAPSPSPVVSRFTFALPEDQRFTNPGRRVVALSPDGTRLVYVANQQLYLRNLYELTSAPISGTEGSVPTEPVFSPDGQWVAFHSNGTVKKVRVTGGTPLQLAAAESPLGARWEDGRILLAQSAPPAIVAIPENGGAAKDLVTLNQNAGELARSPQLIANGRSVLFTLRSRGEEWDDASIVVHELATGQRTVLHRGGTDGRVLPTGHLVYTRAGTTFAVPFDETRLRVTGGSVPVQQGVQGNRATGTSQVAWSASGTFAIAQGVDDAFRSSLLWLNRKGQQGRTALPPRNYGIQASELRLSPDGSRIAATVFSDDVLDLGVGSGSEVLAADLTRGTLTRLSNTGQATSPVWSPDGQRVCYDSGTEMFCQAADGRSAAEALFKVDGLVNARPFSPDGTRMLLETRGAETGDDISIVTIGPPVEIRPLLKTRFSETAPAISPDGRWLAYVSDESGRAEVYVRPFPAFDRGLWPISTGGGTEPRWAPNGRELFFTIRSGGWTTPGVLMSVPVQAGSTFTAGQPTEVLKIPAQASLAYDVARDGRFLFHLQRSALSDEEAPRREIVVVQNWFEELKARVATGATR